MSPCARSKWRAARQGADLIESWRGLEPAPGDQGTQSRNRKQARQDDQDRNEQSRIHLRNRLDLQLRGRAVAVADGPRTRGQGDQVNEDRRRIGSVPVHNESSRGRLLARERQTCPASFHEALAVSFPADHPSTPSRLSHSKDYNEATGEATSWPCSRRVGPRSLKDISWGSRGNRLMSDLSSGLPLTIGRLSVMVLLSLSPAGCGERAAPYQGLLPRPAAAAPAKAGTHSADHSCTCRGAGTRAVPIHGHLS